MFIKKFQSVQQNKSCGGAVSPLGPILVGLLSAALLHRPPRHLPSLLILFLRRKWRDGVKFLALCRRRSLPTFPFMVCKSQAIIRMRMWRLLLVKGKTAELWHGMAPASDSQFSTYFHLLQVEPHNLSGLEVCQFLKSCSHEFWFLLPVYEMKNCESHNDSFSGWFLIQTLNWSPHNCLGISTMNSPRIRVDTALIGRGERESWRSG